MESFLSILCFLGGPCDDYLLDIVGKLPAEVSTMILRNLDPASLLSAALVSRRWLALVRSDRVLRERVLGQLKKQKKMRTKALKFNCRILRGSATVKPFEARNERFKVVMPTNATGIEPAPQKERLPVVVSHRDSSWKAYKEKSAGITIIPEPSSVCPAPVSKKSKLQNWGRRRLLRV